MHVRTSSVVVMWGYFLVSAASAQQVAPPNNGNSNPNRPRPAVAAVPANDTGRIFTADEAKKSHPERMQEELKFIAERITAAGVIDEAQAIHVIEQRVGRELFPKLLTAHQEAWGRSVEPQIAIRVQIIELSESTTFPDHKSSLVPKSATSAANNGLDGQSLSGIYPNDDVSTWISEMKRQGRIKIVASPQITVLDGRPAQFLAGGEMAVPTARTPAVRNGPESEQSANVGSETVEFKPFGTSVVATAKVEPDRLIKMSLVASHTDREQNMRRVQTAVDLREGQSLVCTGLKSMAHVTEVTRIPVLGDAPLIGRFFSTKKLTPFTTELMIVVTAEIIDPSGSGPEDVPTIRNFDSTRVKPAGFVRPEK